MRREPQWSQSQGAPRSHTPGAPGVLKRRTPPRLCCRVLDGPTTKEAAFCIRRGPRWSQSEAGPLAHAAGVSVVLKRRRPFALGPMRPPLQGRGGVLRFGVTEAPTSWARGPPSLWDPRGPHRMGEGASFALARTRPPPHGRWGLSYLGTIKAPAAWARWPPSFWDH